MVPCKVDFEPLDLQVECAHGTLLSEIAREAGVQWITSYFTIVEKREKEPYDSKDVALMDSIRTRILEYYLLGDISIRVVHKQGVPIEAMSLGTFAPTIRY